VTKQRHLFLQALGLAAFAAAFSGCASVEKVAELNNKSGVYSYRHKADKLDGTTLDSVRCVFDVDAPTLFSSTNTRQETFTVRRGTTETASAVYSLDFAYTGDAWDQMGVVKEGQTLSILLDNKERMALSGAGSDLGRGVVTDRVYEVADYPVTRKQLADMAAAKAIKLKISGEKGSEVGVLEEESRKRLAGLLNMFPN
jgi:hypothetical protein